MLQRPESARILIVDDEPTNVHLMERMLARGGYTQTRSVTTSSQVMRVTAEFDPDLILLDFHMPPPDGLALLRELAPWIHAPGMVPVIMLTGNVEAQTRRTALELGARDFVTKPFDLGEVLVRIRNALETRGVQLRTQRQNQLLEQAVAESFIDLEEAQLELVERLALAAECRDDDTQEHAQRVGRTSAYLAGRLGLDGTVVSLIRRAAPLHDIGKIGISDVILLKPGKLTVEEFETMKLHVTVGVNILAKSASPVLRCAEQIVRSHHEHWDGSGYPAGLAGTEIPLAGRIVAVADVFDALTQSRPYKPAWPIEDAVDEICRSAGSHLDPGVVAAFEQLDHASLLGPIGAAPAPPPSPHDAGRSDELDRLTA